ncbi:MAG: YlxR family protein [Propionibacteriaceae bacterium]
MGCRGRAEKSQLLRLVRDLATEQVVVDRTGARPGRGCYLHHDPGCHQLALKRRAIGRALRGPAVDSDQVQRVLSEVPTTDFTGAGA